MHAKNLNAELAELGRLDRATLKKTLADALCTEAPVRIGRALLIQAVAYRLQERALGVLKSSTRRLLERAAEERDERRTAASTRKSEARPGTVLIREWHAVSHRVTVLEDGVLLLGVHHRSLPKVARKITGTRWSGPSFFGLRGSAAEREHGTS